MDIWGPIIVHSQDSFQYFLTIVYDYTQYTWTFLMRNTLDARTDIQNFITYCQTQFSCKIKSIYNDNATKFLMPSYYDSLGILH